MSRPSKSAAPDRRGAFFGLGAAALFGLTPPFAKTLLGAIGPVTLAGLLYFGAAAGLWLQAGLCRTSYEAKLERSDRSKLAIVVLAGGILGPVLMLFGLQRVSALWGSLLLNLEAPFTVLLAVLVFGEHLGKRAAAASALIVAGAGVLKLESSDLGADGVGVLLLALACLCWALDNNLTQRLSLRDPFAIVRVKTLVAGICNTSLGLFVDGKLPDVETTSAALTLGCFGYGVSLVLDVYALRLVGAAREAAYFATAPFMGALASVLVLGDRFTGLDGFAMALMALGVALLLRERHEHLHHHEEVEHEHLHEHDEHHQHAHHPSDPLGSPHSHRHQHAPLVHDHPHLPDAHHRHRH